MIGKIYWSNTKLSTKYMTVINVLTIIILTCNFLAMPIQNKICDKKLLIIPIMFNLILSIMAVIAIIFYSFVFKRKEKYIFLLFYISIAMELIAKISIFISSEKNEFGIFCLGIAFRGIILSLFLVKNSKVAIFKKLTVFNINYFLGFICMSITLIVIEAKKIISIDYSTASLLYSIIFFLLGSCIIKCFIESIKNEDIICSIITLSLIFMCFRFLYQTAHVFYDDINYIGQNSIISEVLLFLSLVTVISTVFIELLVSNKRLKASEEDLNVFYKVVNESNYNKVYIYEKENLIYANAKAKLEANVNLMDEDYLLKLQENIKSNTPAEERKELRKFFSKKKNVTVEIEDNLGNKYNVSHQNIKRVKNNKKLSKDVDVYNVQDKAEIQSNNEILELNKNKFELINKNIEEIVIVTDEHFKITYVNNYCTKAIGFDIETMLEKDISNYLIKNKIEFLLENLSDDIENRWFNDSIITNTGEYKNIKVKMDKLLDKNGKIISYVFVINSNNYEEELEKINIKMQEIENGNITRKESFINLSHELRTPIHILYSSIQLLNNQKEDLPPIEFIKFYEKYERVIRQNTKRMLKIVNNIIDISKLEAGFVDLDLKICNIVSLVEEISMSILPYTSNKGINLVFDTNIEERFIFCDAEKIERIFLNLLSNSIKFTEKDGEILVDIDSNDKWIIIKVRDNGCGIPLYMHDKIFDRFSQVKESMAKNPNGSGIGLSLVKSLVELHNGEIKINSELEFGTEFIVYLPNISEEEHEENIKNKNIVAPALFSNLVVEFSDIE